MTLARDPKQFFWKYLEEESWRRNPGGGTMEEKSWRRNHGRGMMEEWSSRSHEEEIMEEESWRRNHGRGIPFLLKSFARRLRKAPRQAPGKHPGGTQEAPGGGGDVGSKSRYTSQQIATFLGATPYFV
jgi:hypothetical protein